MNGVIPNEGKLLMLAALAAPEPGAPAAGPLNGALLKLFVNDIAQGPDVVLADLTEAGFDGYAEAELDEWGEEYLDELGAPAISPGSSQFNHAGTGDPETVYGMYITDAGETKLLYMERFENPKSMATAVDSVIAFPVLALE